MPDSTRIVFISDTHGKHDFCVPDGDLLVHCGDGTCRGTPDEVRRWGAWMRELPHLNKVFIAGNHDFMFQQNLSGALREFGRSIQPRPPFNGYSRVVNGLHYVQDATVELGVRVASLADPTDFIGSPLRLHGSPWQPEFYDWAFNLPRGADLAEKWALIPSGLDVLVTHGPPMGILDKTQRNEYVGCSDLKRRVIETVPRIHAFGHIHEQHGTLFVGGTLFVNAAVCSINYMPIQGAIVVDLPHERSLPPVVVKA